MSTTTITTTTTTEPATKTIDEFLATPPAELAAKLLPAMHAVMEVKPHEQVLELIHWLSTCDALTGDHTETRRNAAALADHVAKAFAAMGFVEARELATFTRDLMCRRLEALRVVNAERVREAEQLERNARVQVNNLSPSQRARSAASLSEHAAHRRIADLEAAFDITEPPAAAPAPVSVAASVKAELERNTEDLERWDAAGRTLAELDPEAFRAALALVQTMATKAGAS